MTGETVINYLPVPACIVNGHGKVSAANSRIEEVFIYSGIKDTNIYALTGIKYATLTDAARLGKPLTLSRNDKSFKLSVKLLGKTAEDGVVIFFIDITDFERQKDLYDKEKLVTAVVHIDNFDQLTESVSDEASMDVLSGIDKMLRQWSEKLEASITKYKEYMYFLVMEAYQYEKIVESKFAILDEARKIETEDEFPVTLSIGVGVGKDSPMKSEQYAGDALDLALARGGDQAVVKSEGSIEYYGGKTQTVEKANKGKSRIIAHALKQLMDQASKTIVMGHKNPDMDSFGSALGIYKMAVNYGKEAHIIINEYNDALTEIFRASKENGDYSCISTEKAKNIVDENTLLVVVDTNRPELTECRELLEQTRKIVVIDHHRRAQKYIENPVLSYTEPYASSASELVAEIIQYSGVKKAITKFEAEALLAGITVDTNRFSVKTGVRTFEAASWLRRCGADTTEVKKYFQTDLEMFKTRAKCIAEAEFIEGGFAMSICPGQNENAQIVNSQVADELLTIKGIKASFVAGRNERGRTVLSARSLGELNVQMILENFGGGGHLTTAGAQVDFSPEEALVKLKRILKETFKENKEE